MRKPVVAFLLVLLLCCSACSATTGNTVAQTSTIDALLAGAYDGNMACRELLKHGDLGIGTFDHLDGEMTVLNGTVYQIKSDGRVYTPDETITTPFAAVCAFDPDYTLPLENGMDYEALKAYVDSVIANRNVFCALKITGTFKRMKTRAVPRQQKPYPPLIDVTRNQPVFDMENVSGTIAGFRCPPFVRGINVPGYHLHFISDDHKRGGHILDFELISGISQMDVCNRFLLILPEKGEGLEDLDLSKDRSKELEHVEQ